MQGQQLDERQEDMLRAGTALRNIGWLSFWGQLALTVVSTTILLFSTGVPSSTGIQVRAPGWGSPAGWLRMLEGERWLACRPPNRGPASPTHLLTTTQFSVVDVATMFGIVCGYLSTFLAWSYTRAGMKLGRLQARAQGGTWTAMQAWGGCLCCSTA